MILNSDDIYIEPVHLIKNNRYDVFIEGTFLANNTLGALKEVYDLEVLFLKALNLYQKRYTQRVIYTTIFNYNDNF